MLPFTIDQNFEMFAWKRNKQVEFVIVVYCNQLFEKNLVVPRTT